MTHENECIELLDKKHLVNNDNMLQTIADEKEFHMEVPSGNRTVVSAGELFHSQEWINEKGSLPLMLGKSVNGEISILDLARDSNLLIAGCTGTGKSVLMDLCLFSLMFRHTPNDLKLILIDPKYVEYDRYKDLPYLKFPIINNTEDTHKVLLWLNKEMEHRYELLHEADCRNIQDMNRRKTASMPYIVIFINELADSMSEARSQMESQLIPLCSRGRAIGIHLVISTVRSDLLVLTKCIMANFPTRIAFYMVGHEESKLVIDSDEATNLLRCGDMLCRVSREDLKRIQGGYINEEEAARIIQHLKKLYKDIKSDTLSVPLDMTSDKYNMIFRDKLDDIVYDILCRTIDYDDDDLGSVADEIADSIVDYMEEFKLQNALKNIPKANDELYESMDLGNISESDNSSSNKNREMLLKTVKIIFDDGYVKRSNIQRKLKIGYSQVCNLLESLEDYGIISTPHDNGTMTILAKTFEDAVKLLPQQD